VAARPPRRPDRRSRSRSNRCQGGCGVAVIQPRCSRLATPIGQGRKLVGFLIISLINDTQKFMQAPYHGERQNRGVGPF
jgi:hypothetical protein